MLRDRGDIGIVLCDAGRPFGEQVLESLGRQFEKHSSDGAGPENNFRRVQSTEKHFAGTEIKTSLEESVRGMDIYIIQDVANTHLPYSVDENFRALKTAADACRRADAACVTVILPYFPYARQDRAIGRECWTASQVAGEIELTQVDRVVTLDIHNPTVGGFFRTAKFENLLARRTFIDHIRANFDLGNAVMGAPDFGAMKRNKEYSDILRVPLIGVHKERDYTTGEVIDEDDEDDEIVTIFGDVSGRDVIFVDDMIDRAGTVVNASRAVKKAGARKVYFMTSLAVLSDPAKERLDGLYRDGLLTGVIATNAIYHGPGFVEDTPWLEEVSVSGYHAKVIFNINHHLSISRLLE